MNSSLTACVKVFCCYIFVRSLWRLEETTWWASDRADKAANKLEALELRVMMKGIRGHELVRHIMMAITEFMPNNGDPSWLMRQMRNLVAAFCEDRMRYGAVTEDDMGAILRYYVNTVYMRSQAPDIFESTFSMNFLLFEAELCTGTPLNGISQKNVAECTQNQHRRPTLRPFSGRVHLHVKCVRL